LKFNQKNNLYLANVDVSASTEAFLETVCLIAVRRSVSNTSAQIALVFDDHRLVFHLDVLDQVRFWWVCKWTWRQQWTATPREVLKYAAKVYCRMKLGAIRMTNRGDPHSRNRGDPHSRNMYTQTSTTDCS